MVGYDVEVQEDGRSLISWRGEDSERITGLVASIAGGISSYGAAEEKFAREALKSQIKKETTDFLGGLGFFGLTRVLKHPECYTVVGEVSPINFGFDRYELWKWNSGSVRDVKSYLYVEPRTDGKLLADFEIEKIPEGPVFDLFQIYHTLHGGFEYERLEKNRETVKIRPVTEGVHALEALKRVSEVYRRAVGQGVVEEVSTPLYRVREDPQVQIRRTELYRLKLLEILGMDAISQ